MQLSQFPLRLDGHAIELRIYADGQFMRLSQIPLRPRPRAGTRPRSLASHMSALCSPPAQRGEMPKAEGGTPASTVSPYPAR